MSEYRTHATLGAPRRLCSVPPAQRTFVSAVVTELAMALEPVARDPFMDGSDDAPRSARGSWRPRPRRRPMALSH
jgi:hypothetical protein